MTASSQAHRAVELTLLAVMRERHPGVRWELVQDDRAHLATASAASGKSCRGLAGPADPDAVDAERPPAEHDDAVDGSGEEATAGGDV